ncbi:hypothetical protein [Corynebacterium sphenisci]|uniref:hypothetical protein n=1 Tax=Corynebacterium sphenisci TaxID=191493 RepID=UPI0026DEB223|nr:hypothetical protein [Corynebacterium sphenisci]MDO5730670.1 hypothetical protein [Corynebacterium sphenisci]
MAESESDGGAAGDARRAGAGPIPPEVRARLRPMALLNPRGAAGGVDAIALTRAFIEWRRRADPDPGRHARDLAELAELARRRAAEAGDSGSPAAGD